MADQDLSQAAGTNSPKSVEVCVGDAAWDAFISGNAEDYRSRTAEAALALSSRCDVVVLAQASMEPAAALLAGPAIPVLTSPRAPIEAVAAVILFR